MREQQESSAATIFQPEAEWERYIAEGPMKFSPSLVARLKEELTIWQRDCPNGIVEGKYFEVQASLGSACYVSPDGYAYTSFMDVNDPDMKYIDDHRFHGRTTALILGSEFIPELLTALPQRPLQAVDCDRCQRIRQECEISPAERFMYCPFCSGLGWLMPGYEQMMRQQPFERKHKVENKFVRLLKRLFTSPHV
jgi:hypothetical protein